MLKFSIGFGIVGAAIWLLNSVAVIFFNMAVQNGRMVNVNLYINFQNISGIVGSLCLVLFFIGFLIAQGRRV